MLPFAIQFMVPLFAKTVSITSNWTKWIPNMALVIGENAIDIYKSSKWFGVPGYGTRITSGNTKCITYTLLTLGRSLWATRKTSFLSSNYLTPPFRVWLGGGEGSLYLHHYLTQPFRVWLGEWGGIILLASLLDSAIHAITSSPGAIIITIMMKMKMNNTRKKKIKND